MTTRFLRLSDVADEMNTPNPRPDNEPAGCRLWTGPVTDRGADADWILCIPVPIDCTEHPDIRAWNILI
jgi:hypothetical protein